MQVSVTDEYQRNNGRCYQIAALGSSLFKWSHSLMMYNNRESIPNKKVETRLALLSCGSALELIEKVLTLPDPRKLLIISLLWCWWTNRNKQNSGEGQQSVEELQFTIVRHSTVWKEHLQNQNQTQPKQLQIWTPPPTDWIKVNVDGAFCKIAREIWCTWL